MTTHRTINGKVKVGSKYDGTIDNITINTDMADDLMEEFGMKKDQITINGHRLKEDDDSVYCTDCDEEYEIPQLLQESSGFNEVVYRLYLMGKFKEEHYCSSSLEKTEHKVHPNKGNPLTGSGKPYNHGSSPNVQISGTAFMGPDGDKYHIGGGEITNLETGYVLDSTEKKELLVQLHQKI